MRRRETMPGATLSEYEGVRYLHLGTDWVQGAMRIRKPQTLELEYVQRMMAWMLLREPEALTEGRAVQLGLGAASLTRYCHSVLRMPTTAVEINGTVIDACRLYFHLPDDDARLQVVEGNAAAWVDDPAHLQCASVLNVDLYDHEAASPVLDSAAFYAACRGVLDDGGLMTVNLFGRDASFDTSLARITEAFGPSQVWWLAPTREGNTIVIAGRDVAGPDRETLQQRAAAVEERFGLPARKWVRLFKRWQPVEEGTP